MYEADPFAARREVDERQAKAAQKKEERASDHQGDSHKSSVSPEFAQAPEVKMSSGLRDLVEETVKKVSRSLLTYPARLQQSVGQCLVRRERNDAFSVGGG
jgi:hypothetical protein